MLSSLFNVKGLAIAAGISFLVGSFVGGKVVYTLWDVAAQREQIANLTTQIKARDEAAKQDATLAVKDTNERLELERKSRAIEDQISAGVCLDQSDADRVRGLWK